MHRYLGGVESAVTRHGIDRQNGMCGEQLRKVELAVSEQMLKGYSQSLGEGEG